MTIEDTVISELTKPQILIRRKNGDLDIIDENGIYVIHKDKKVIDIYDLS